MLTFNHGQWIEDTTISNDWKIIGEELSYGDYDSDPGWVIGEKHVFHAEVYWIREDLPQDAYERARYKFFVATRDIGRTECILVTDYPSLLMLLKEIEPLIRFEMDLERFEMLAEEHLWKAKKGGYQSNCIHMLRERRR